jgi:hypothetical protein
MQNTSGLIGGIKSSWGIISWIFNTIKWMMFFPILAAGAYSIYFIYFEFNFYNEYVDYTWHKDVSLLGQLMIDSNIHQLDEFKDFILQIFYATLLLIASIVAIYRMLSSPVIVEVLKHFLVDPCSVLTNKLLSSLNKEAKYITLIIIIFAVCFGGYVLNTVLVNNERIIPKLVEHPKDRISPLQKLIKDINHVKEVRNSKSPE